MRMSGWLQQVWLVNSLFSLKNVNKTQISKVLVNIDRVAVHPSLPLLSCSLAPQMCLSL